jgi:hypothetical protein
LFPTVSVDHLYDDIPANAVAVVLLDTEELMSLAATELLYNPSANPFDESEEDEEDSEVYSLAKLLSKGLWHGLEIPEQIIYFVNEIGDGSNQILLPVSDTLKFRAFLENLPDSSGWYVNETGLWTNNSQYISIKKDHIILCLSRPEMRRDINYSALDWSHEVARGLEVEDVFARYHLTQRSELIGRGAIQSLEGKLRLSYQSMGSLGFEGRVTESLPFSLAFQMDINELRAAVNDKSNHHFMQGPINNFGFTSLIRDSIWDGRFELYIEGLSSKKEEFISYSYNDDFEKIERKDFKNVFTADLLAEIGLARPTDSLFYKKEWVKEVNGVDLFIKYPVQEVKFSEDLSQVTLMSGDINLMDSITSGQSERFLTVDMLSLEQEWNKHTPDSLASASGIKYIEGSLAEAGNELQFDFEFSDEKRQGLFAFLNAPIFSFLHHP